MFVYFGNISSFKHWRLNSTALFAFDSLRLVCSIDLAVFLVSIGKSCKSSPSGISLSYHLFRDILNVSERTHFHYQKIIAYIMLTLNNKHIRLHINRSNVLSASSIVYHFLQSNVVFCDLIPNYLASRDFFLKHFIEQILAQAYIQPNEMPGSNM